MSGVHTTVKGRSELQELAVKHWQQVGTLHRMIGQFANLALQRTRLRPMSSVATKQLLAEVLVVTAEYEAKRKEYLDTHPEVAAIYYKAAAKESSRKRSKRGKVDNNETN